MNRKEFATKIQDLINRAYLADVPKSYYKGLFDEAEKLRYPITLAEFLGWEENVEYDYKDLYVLKVENNRLFMKSEKCSSGWCNFALFTDEIEELQQATKVERPKAYHVKDEYSYNELMKELEEQGYVWNNFMRRKPTEYNPIEEIDDINYNSVYIFTEKNTNRITLENHFTNNDKETYDLIEYHKEEPRYYAKIKGWELYSDNDYYWKYYIEDELFVDYKFENELYKTKFTKTEWNKLGINDTNVDFEKVED